MNIKKAILKVFSTNFIQLISGIIIGFVVPAILSINEYANLKTYTLYISYIGLLHFGYLDGLHLKYGGKKYNEIDKATLKGEHILSIIIESIVTIILLLISLIRKDLILMLFSLSILPVNMSTFYKGIYQATGNFENYSKIMNIYTITYTLLNLLLALIFKSNNYIFYCAVTILSSFFAIISFEFKFWNETKDIKTIIPKDFVKILKTGIFILLGNLSVVALFGIDKWFVKLFLTENDFAYYSFAVSMLNIINVLVNAISITFYNYLFSNNNKEKINKLKRYLILLGGFSSLGYFVLSFIVSMFIKKYIASLSIISIIFSIFPYMIIINALYVNLYKVNKKEKKYLKVVLSMLIISILYNTIAVFIFKISEAIAFATVLTLLTWVIYSTKTLKNVYFDKKNVIFCLIITTSFLVLSHCFNWFIGGIIYFLIYVILVLIFYKDIFYELIDILKKFKIGADLNEKNNL